MINLYILCFLVFLISIFIGAWVKKLLFPNRVFICKKNSNCINTTPCPEIDNKECPTSGPCQNTTNSPLISTSCPLITPCPTNLPCTPRVCPTSEPLVCPSSVCTTQPPCTACPTSSPCNSCTNDTIFYNVGGNPTFGCFNTDLVYNSSSGTTGWDSIACNYTQNSQKIYLKYFENNEFQLRNSSNIKCLSSATTPWSFQDCSTSDTKQRFNWVNRTSGRGIKNKNTGRCLDIGSIVNGAYVTSLNSSCLDTTDEQGFGLIMGRSS